MTKQEAKKRIDKLKKVIDYHRYLYHVLDRQEISDAALDSLKHELFKLEQKLKYYKPLHNICLRCKKLNLYYLHNLPRHNAYTLHMV